MTRNVLCLVALLFVRSLGAQEPRFFYPEPRASAFAVTRNMGYGADDTALRMDVYRPARASRAQPALVFFTLGNQRANPGYAGWARLAASKGLVAVLADLRPANGTQDFSTLLAHLASRGSSMGIDTAAIAVFGASVNAFTAFPFVENAGEKRVKAAVMLYSNADVRRFRHDLPVLYVRAGLDRQSVNSGIDSVVARALAQNAPVTIINNAGGHHSFETTDDDAITREVIDQAITFVKGATSRPYRAALAASMSYATAAAYVSAGSFAQAAALLAQLVTQRPDDAPLRLSYGEALLGDRQFARACAEFAKLKNKGLGPRDLGLPAARACVQSGDASAAMAWLASIPKQFIPPRVRDDPALAALRERADFQALFTP